VIIGAMLIGSALLVPYMGGAEKLIIAINSLLVVPLYAPALWGLFSKHIGIKDMLWVSLSSFSLGALVKFGIVGNPWMMEFDNLVGIIEYLKANSKNVEVSIGVVMPIVMLILLEWRNRSRVQDPGWANIENQRLSVEKELEESSGSGVFDPMPANIVIASLLICGTAMVFLSLIADSGQGIIVVFAIALFVIAGIIYAGVKRLIRKALN
jgi:SSS family solute:Na+ symporter